MMACSRTTDYVVSIANLFESDDKLINNSLFSADWRQRWEEQWASLTVWRPPKRVRPAVRRGLGVSQ